MQKTNKKEFRIEKVLKIKEDELYVKRNEHDNSFNSRINKRRPCMKMGQYFTNPFRSFGGHINVTVDLSNYATKTDLKNVTHVDTSNFSLKTNLASLKTEVDKLDIDKLAPVVVDLSQFSDVVKDDVLKKLFIIDYLQK